MKSLVFANVLIWEKFEKAIATVLGGKHSISLSAESGQGVPQWENALRVTMSLASCSTSCHNGLLDLHL